MATMVSAPKELFNSQRLLEHSSYFLPMLADSQIQDLVFYSMDREGRFVYLSKSAQKVLTHNPSDWLGRSFREALTDAPCNENICSACPSDPISTEIECRTCEIIDNVGNRLRLKVWATPILHAGVSIGKTGLIQRFTEAEVIDSKLIDLIAKSRLLSVPEKQVIDMVYEGKLNKSIAKELAISMRTVEGRRSKSMKKLGVKSFSELIQVWSRLKSATITCKDA